MSKTIDEVEAFLAKYGVTSDYFTDKNDNKVDDDFENYEYEEDEDITTQELDGIGYGFGFNLDKILDPRYNKHILS